LPNANSIIARQRRKIAFLPDLSVRACNGLYIRYTDENHWRASLVPAAAVIPAPRAYPNVVAFRKPVVGFERLVSETVWGSPSGGFQMQLASWQDSETCGNIGPITETLHSRACPQLSL